MGLSISYSGNIATLEMIDPLIEEVTAICKELDWSMQTFDDDRIKGVSFAPIDCDPVFLTFDADGRLLSPINILVEEIYDDSHLDRELMFTASTKTQFAGVDAHISIIKLLKYISKKYLKDFKLTDEGDYWESGDEDLLAKQFDRYNKALDILSDTLKDFPVKENESPQSLSKRLEEYLTAKMKNQKREDNEL